MKNRLLSIAIAAAALPVFAQPITSVVMEAPESSTLSLIAAGVVALAVARRKNDGKVTKS